MVLAQLSCHLVNNYKTSVFMSCTRVANRRHHLKNMAKENIRYSDTTKVFHLFWGTLPSIPQSIHRWNRN